MLRLLAVPMGITFLIVYALLDDSQRQIVYGATPPNVTEFDWAPLLVPISTAMLVWPWIAVSFHRFMLRCEPVGVMPGFHWGLIGRYLGMGLLIGVIVMLAAGPVAMFGTITLRNLGGDAALYLSAGFLLLLGAVTFYFVMRLTSGLPGLAVGDAAAFEKAWRATSNRKLTILLLVLIPFGAFFLLDLLINILGIPVLAYVMTDWFSALLNLSILTTLWGHLVEGRELR